MKMQDPFASFFGFPFAMRMRPQRQQRIPSHIYEAVITIQRWWRKKLALRRHHRRYLAKRFVNKWRMFCRERKEKRECGAIVIQRRWRQELKRRRERREAAAAPIITRAIRRGIACSRARRIMSSMRELRRIRADAATVPADVDTQKGRLIYEHSLERLLLATDCVASHGSDLVRADRKFTVQELETRLSVLESLAPLL